MHRGCPNGKYNGPSLWKEVAECWTRRGFHGIPTQDLPIFEAESCLAWVRLSWILMSFPVCLRIAALFGTAVSALAVEKPNIVFILADDVGDQAIGCYGGTSYSTPRVDRLAAGGARFRHCYSMPVCHPTRVTLMTGKYPFRVGNAPWGTFPKALRGRRLQTG